MLTLFQKQWKLFPITTLLVLVSAGLYVASRGYIAYGPPSRVFIESPSQAQEQLINALIRFGAVGLDELWSGDWWRLAVSGFHHGFLLHLLGNVVVILLLGKMMEPRCSRWWYLLFCLGSSTVTIASEALIGYAAVGLSGTGCAMFGYLLMLRRNDFQLQAWLPGIVIWSGIASLVVGIPMKALGLIQVANLAHFSGLGYGLLVGWFVRGKDTRIANSTFIAAHALLVPLCMLAMRPTWTDIYRSTQADNEENPDRRIALLADLLEDHPERAYTRVALTDMLMKQNRTDEAWRTALEGWNGNETPVQKLLTQELRVIWLRLKTPEEREAASAVMDELFADQSQYAKDKLDLAWRSVESEFLIEYNKAQAEKALNEREPANGENLPSPDESGSASLGLQG